MIKTKLFTTHGEGLDLEVNDFLDANNVEVIDIKFQTAITDCRVFYTALLIYKDGDQDE